MSVIARLALLLLCLLTAACASPPQDDDDFSSAVTRNCISDNMNTAARRACVAQMGH